MLRAARVACGRAVACCAFAGGVVVPVRQLDASKGWGFVQCKDKASGLPLWVIEVIDADPEARTKTVRVKIAASVQPTLPAPLAGSPFTPVEFTGLTVTPYVNQAGRLAYSLRASGGSGPGKPGSPPRREAA